MVMKVRWRRQPLALRLAACKRLLSRSTYARSDPTAILARPAFSHVLISQRMRGSPMRSSTNFISHW